MATDNRVIKLCVLGTRSVGKTSLVIRLTRGVFEGTHTNKYLSVEYAETVHRAHGRNYKIIIYDSYDEVTDYKELATLNCERDGVLLVYAPNDRGSYTALQEWLALLKLKMPYAPIMILANKCDLGSHEVPFNRAYLKYNKEGNVIGVMETSCRYGTNVEQAYSILIEKIYTMRDNEQRKCISNMNESSRGFEEYVDDDINLFNWKCCILPLCKLICFCK